MGRRFLRTTHYIYFRWKITFEYSGHHADALGSTICNTSLSTDSVCWHSHVVGSKHAIFVDSNPAWITATRLCLQLTTSGRRCSRKSHKELCGWNFCRNAIDCREKSQCRQVSRNYTQGSIAHDAQVGYCRVCLACVPLRNDENSRWTRNSWSKSKMRTRTVVLFSTCDGQIGATGETNNMLKLIGLAKKFLLNKKVTSDRSQSNKSRRTISLVSRHQNRTRKWCH